VNKALQVIFDRGQSLQHTLDDLSTSALELDRRMRQLAMAQADTRAIVDGPARPPATASGKSLEDVVAELAKLKLAVANAIKQLNQLTTRVPTREYLDGVVATLRADITRQLADTVAREPELPVVLPFTDARPMMPPAATAPLWPAPAARLVADEPGATPVTPSRKHGRGPSGAAAASPDPKRARGHNRPTGHLTAAASSSAAPARGGPSFKPGFETDVLLGPIARTLFENPDAVPETVIPLVAARLSYEDIEGVVRVDGLRWVFCDQDRTGQEIRRMGIVVLSASRMRGGGRDRKSI
jgi:hypothetical protein